MEVDEYKKLFHLAIRESVKEFTDGSSFEMSVLKHLKVPENTGFKQAEGRLLSLYRQDVLRFLKDRSFRSEEEPGGIFYILGEKHLNTIHSFYNGKFNSFNVKLPKISKKKEAYEFVGDFLDKFSNKFVEVFDVDRVPMIKHSLFTKEVFMEDIYEDYEDYSLNIRLESFYEVGEYLNLKIVFDFIPSSYLKNNELVIFKKAFIKIYVPDFLYIPRGELPEDLWMTDLVEKLLSSTNRKLEDIIKALEIVFLERYRLAYVAAFEPGSVSPKAALMYNGKHYRLFVQNLKQSREVLNNLVELVDSGYKKFLSEDDDGLIRDDITFSYIVPKLFGQNVKKFFNPLVIKNNFSKGEYTKLLSRFSERIGRSSVYFDPLSTAISLVNESYVFKTKMKINGKNLFVESKPIFRISADLSGKVATLL